jgi:hypothetical protein
MGASVSLWSPTVILLTLDVTVAAVSARTERIFAIFVVVFVLGALLLYPFTRRIGGNQAADGGPGGSEAAIVGVTWFLIALAAGVYLAQDTSVAVG